MRLLLTILIIAALSGIGQKFGPWWSAAAVAGIVAFFSKLRTGIAMLAGFAGIALLWAGFTMYYDSVNEHRLTGKLAELFHLPNYITYIIATMALGGIVGAIPAWAGAHLRKMLRPQSFVEVT